ncbi:hypothetical protein Pfo_031064 [Paulownia fortunei]|nr:hypothetical protein Pfo_031064 [Paulownia fortunei]
MDVDSKPTMEETILVGDDLMMGPPSPLIPPEIASHVLEGVDLCDGILRNLFLCLQINDIEPFCQDEIALYRQCAERRDKELRQRLQDSERKLGMSMPLEQAKERFNQLDSESTQMESSYVRESINVSRKRMDVSALDMLQFHWWDYSNPGYLDALKHLTDLKEEGKIKTVALTNFDTERLQKILEKGIPVVSNQVQHSIVDMRPQQKMAELCQLTGVKLITYGTVMGGLLSEKFLDTNLTIPFAGPPLNTPSLQKYKRMVDAWGGWSLFQVLLQTLKRVASKHGVSIPTVAVRCILDQQAVAGSMIGVRLGLSEHIKDASAVFSLVLDEDDISSILEVSQKGKDLMKIIGDCGDEYRRM